MPTEPEAYCKNCGKGIWFDSIPGRGWRHVSVGGGGSYDCYEPMHATPGGVKGEAKKPKA
jgi:hypothetical protein